MDPTNLKDDDTSSELIEQFYKITNEELCQITMNNCSNTKNE